MFQSITNIKNEIDFLLQSKKKVQTAQKALEIICAISTECLEQRSRRLEIDLVQDFGQIELVKVSSNDRINIREKVIH